MIARELTLRGCRKEPLIHYLKALGVFRLVSEQIDPVARAFWEGDCLVLQTKLTREALEDFFIEKYQPSPVVVPWSGSHFFDYKTVESPVHSKTPTGADALAAFLEVDDVDESGRFSDLKSAILLSLETLKEMGITEKKQFEKSSALKSAFISTIRGKTSQSGVEWVDSAAVLDESKASFSTLLGSGGGSDGRLHFADNFLQNLWDVLPDFDEQRRPIQKKKVEIEEKSRGMLANSLFRELNTELIGGRTSGLFDAGAVGGPNATQGFERSSATNPWDIIFALEGAVCFAGAISRKAGTNVERISSFPFQVYAAPTGSDSIVESESSGREFWLPVWNRASTFDEITYFLSEGRLQIGRRQASRGDEAARAVAELGVSRGITSFLRFGAFKGRVGGDNYYTTSLLEEFEVRGQKGLVKLLKKIHPWITSFRRASRGDGPQRFASAVRRYDRAVFDFCRSAEGGGEDVERFREIVECLGEMEKQVATSPSFQGKNVRPLPFLGEEWIKALADNSPEFSLAFSLSGLRPYGKRKKNNGFVVGSFRNHLEPTDPSASQWTGRKPFQTWNSNDLITNLTKTAERRLLESTRVADSGSELATFDSTRFTDLNCVSLFLCDAVDTNTIEKLVWPLACIRIGDSEARKNWRFSKAKHSDSIAPVPRVYALLKLAMMPPHAAAVLGFGRVEFETSGRKTYLSNIILEKRIFSLLKARDIPTACAVAARRLRIANVDSKQFLMPRLRASALSNDSDWELPSHISSERLAASLLFPLSRADYERLKNMIFSVPKNQKDRCIAKKTETKNPS